MTLFNRNLSVRLPRAVILTTTNLSKDCSAAPGAMLGKLTAVELKYPALIWPDIETGPFSMSLSAQSSASSNVYFYLVFAEAHELAAQSELYKQLLTQNNHITFLIHYKTNFFGHTKLKFIEFNEINSHFIFLKNPNVHVGINEAKKLMVDLRWAIKQSLSKQHHSEIVEAKDFKPSLSKCF